MGATEILQALRKNSELTSSEIAEQTYCSATQVKRAIKRLLKDVSENLEFRQLTQEEKKIRYGRKIGCKVNLYWLNE